MKQFEQFRSKKDGQYYFNLRDADGNLLIRSEGYKSKRGRNVGINAVRKCSQFLKNYNKKTVKKRDRNVGGFYFVLKAENGEPLGTSAMFADEEARDRFIDLTIKNAI